MIAGKRRSPLFNVCNFIGLTILAFVMFYPFWNVAVYSFNDALDSIRGGIYFWPRQFTLHNYAKLFHNPAIYHATLVSVLRAVIGTSSSVFCTMMLAYTLSRRDFVLRKPVSILFVMTMFFSGGMIPGYMLIRSLGMIDSFWAYIIPGLISAFNMIIMRTSIEALPEGVIESAKIDGAGDFAVFLRIVFPLSMPVVATVTLFSVVGHWNSWFDTFLYNSQNPNLSTLQYELMKVLQSANMAMQADSNNPFGSGKPAASVTPASLRASITMLVSVPIIVVYPFLQKYFAKGVMIGGVKE